MAKNNLKSKLTRTLAGVFAASLLVVSLPAETEPYHAASTSSAEVEALKSRLAQAEKNRKYYEDELYKARVGKKNASEEKSYFDSLIASTEDKLTAAKELIAQYDIDILMKEKEISDNQADYQKKYDVFKERMVLSHEEGTLNYLEILFSAESFTDFLVSVERLGDILEYENSLMNELEGMKVKLDGDLSDLNQKRNEQNDIKDQLILDEEKYSALSAEREAQIEQFSSDTSKYQVLYESSKKAEQELDAEIEKKLAEIAKQSALSYVGGKFNWPLDPSIKYVSSGYGWRTLWGKKDFHLGIDIPAGYGKNVYASNGGTVVTATKHSSYGYYVIIDHGGGIATLYAHNSKLLVSAGDTVKQGDVIAKVGSTGNSSGNHVHFEIRVNGKTTDPLKYKDFVAP